MEEKKRVLVISAHAADYVWRAGGTIANYTRAGHIVKIICLSYGQRGESDSCWKNIPNVTEEAIAEIRRKESVAAAKVLGCTIDFYGLQDHYMSIDKNTIMRLAKDVRLFQPDIVITHNAYDPFNPDHDTAHNAVLAALRSANVSGTFPDIPRTKQVEIFCYEPDQIDVSRFDAHVLTDTTDSWETKKEAMRSISTQASFMIPMYQTRGEFRGSLASRFLANVKYAEPFQRITPFCGKFLSGDFSAAYAK